MSVTDLRAQLFSQDFRGIMNADCTRALDLIRTRRWPQVILIEANSAEIATKMAAFVAAAHYCETRSACFSCGACLGVQTFRCPDLWWCETDEKQLKLVDVHPVAAHITVKALSDRVPRMAILEDADKLNVHAANALLKSLEEAPESAVLILTTAKAKYMMDTILSRCVRWRLDDRHITSEEQVNPAVLSLLMAKTDGDLIAAAEQLTKQEGLSVGELLTMAEYALNKAYKEQNIAIIGDLTRIKTRRHELRRLKRWATRHKITLNAQLSAESIGLG